MRMSFFAMVQVVIIVADIRDQLAVSEFQNSGSGTVDKIAVMADIEYGSLVSGNGTLQNLFGNNVQVVGWLIQ